MPKCQSFIGERDPCKEKAMENSWPTEAGMPAGSCREKLPASPCLEVLLSFPEIMSPCHAAVRLLPAKRACHVVVTAWEGTILLRT